MKRLLKIVAVNLLILAAFLLIFEAGLRLFWRMSALKGSIYRVSSDKILRYELKPDMNTVYDGKPVAINSAGFRGGEYKISKDKDTFRVVLIGDSATFGRMLSFEDSIGERLRSALSSACPGRKVEVLNMGVEGYNSAQELEVLKAKGLKYGPDLVVVYYCFNDPEEPEYYFEKNFINRNFRIAQYILYKAKKHAIKAEKKKKGIKSIEDNFRYLYSTEGWRIAKGAIMAMGDLTAAHGVKMVLLIVPEMSEPVKDFRDGYPFRYINNMLTAIRHDNITVIDPMEEFSRLNLNKADIAVWSYAGRQANDIIAAYAIKKLQENNFKLCE
ncbi:MAG: hypothetical protein WC532_04150 [Candidatus Omnitrophota bacterium]